MEGSAKDLPPKSTVHDYLELWNWDGTLERIHHALYVAVREQAGREASPTVAIIDLQTAKGAQKGGLGSILQATTRARRLRVASWGILVDTLGLLLNVIVHPADVQDRDGALPAVAPGKTTVPVYQMNLLLMVAMAGEEDGARCLANRSMKAGDREASRCLWLRGLAQKVDCRKDVRLDQSQSPPGSRLRALRYDRRRLRPPRHDPHHAQAPCCKRLFMN